jgi:hypothetical protein
VAAAAAVAIAVGALARGAPPTPSGAEAGPKPAEAVAAPAEAAPPAEPARTPYSEELADLDRELAAPEGREEFRLALGLLARARTRYGDTVWTDAVDQRTAVLRSKIDAHFAFLEALLKEAKPEEAGAIRGRVARWGLEEYAAKLEGPRPVPAPAAKPPAEAKPEPAKFVIPTEPPRSPAAQAYLDDWRRAAARATLRDFDAALNDLRRASRSYAEDEVRREAAADQEDLRRAAAVLQDVADALARLAPGTALTLERREPAGAARTVAGSVVRADPDRVELSVPGLRETVFVEYADATAPCLAEFVRGKADARTLALLCLLEGAADAAARLLRDRPDAVAPKYWEYSEAVRTRPPSPDPAARRLEESARQLYYAAEREFRSPSTRGPAVEKYRALAREFFDTSLVRRAALRIAQRSEAYREYLFLAADLRAAGTFQKAERPPVGACRTATSETDLSRGHLNYVELEFYALTEAPYRAWVQAGACCLESFTAFYQTTDLVAPHPAKPNLLLAVEPGTRFGLPIPQTGLSVKPYHADHAPGKPKEPAVWAWLEIPLPRYKAAGVKRLRIMTHQRGFSVARVAVSSARQAPPLPAEVKELETSRE